jgi:hypothetical protein
MLRICFVKMHKPFYLPCFNCTPNPNFATCFHAGILLGLFDLEGGGDKFLWNVG